MGIFQPHVGHRRRDGQIVIVFFMDNPPHPPSLLVIAHNLPQIIALRQFAAARGCDRDMAWCDVAWLAPEFLLRLGGVGYVAALRDQARLAVPEGAVATIVDCSDAAGWVMHALDYGFDGLIYRGDAGVLAKLQTLAANWALSHPHHPPPLVFSDISGSVLDLPRPDPLAAAAAQTAASLAALHSWVNQLK
ncbi:MAG: hypothetical protein QM537_05655 [Candidatus Symbiobacter sp.]|nr:hypothetical protein [Candidatus Symbiobacter sp.]